MKDLIGKLTELEATAPKAPAGKKMLTEDSTSPMIVEPKTRSLKDVFNELSETVAPGTKPLAVMDPQNKKAGVGVLSSPNPGVQNILKNLDPKDVQIVMTQQQPTQQPAQQQQQQQQGQVTGTTGATQGGQGNAMSVAPGQQQVKEKDEGKPGKNFAKIAKSAAKRYGSKEAGERVAGAVRAKLAKQGKLEEEQLDELSPELLKRASSVALGKQVKAANKHGGEMRKKDSDWAHKEVSYADYVGPEALKRNAQAKKFSQAADDKLGEGAGAKDWHDDMEQWALNKGRKNTGGKSSLERAADRDKDWALSHRKSDTVKEEQLDELSPEAYRNYIDKAVRSKAQASDDIGAHRGAMVKTPRGSGNIPGDKSPAAKAKADAAQKTHDKRYRGIDMAVRGLGKEEQLDELSPETLQRAAGKARGQANWAAGIGDYYSQPNSSWEKKEQGAKFNKFADKRSALAKKADAKAGVTNPTQPEPHDWMNKGSPVKEGAKVDRMVKHIKKSERKLGKSKEKASDIAWATVNKRGMLDNKNKKVKEGDIPSSQGIDTKGAGLGAGRSMTTLEEAVSVKKEMGKYCVYQDGKRVGTYNAKYEADDHAKGLKDKAKRKETNEGKEPQVEVIDNAFNRENYKDLIGKKYPKSKAPAYARVKEISEGAKPDFLDLDKDGNKKEPMKKAAADKKKQKVKESMNHRISAARLEGKSHGLRGHAHCGKSYEDLDEMKAYHEGYIDGLNECYGQGVYEAAPAMPPATVGGMADQEVEEGLKDNLKKAGIAALMAGNLATIGTVAKKEYDYRKTDPEIGMSQADADRIMGTDSRRSAYDREQERLGNYRFEEDEMEEGNLFTGNLAKARAAGKKVADLDGDGDMEKVKETAFAFEAWDKQLKALINEGSEVNEGMSVSISKGQQNSPDSVTITAQDQEADELLAFVKQAGLGLFGGDEGHEAHPSSAMSLQPAHGAADEVGAGGVDIDVVDDSDSMLSLMKKLGGVEQSGAEDYADEEGDEDCGCQEETNEATCNECGMHEGMHESGCSMGKGKEMVDEVESEDQQEFEVAEANAPDSGEKESTADEDAEAKEDAALAGADSEDEQEVNESFFDLLGRLNKLAESAEEDEEDVTESEEEDEEDAIEESEELNEWANQVGKGPGKGTDASFEQDIEFMTKVIAGGLNKPKSTGQTTIPVIAGQDERMHDNPKDWATLAGIKK